MSINDDYKKFFTDMNLNHRSVAILRFTNETVSGM